MQLPPETFRAALEASNTAILITDAGQDQEIRYVNPAFTRLTGYRAEDAVGRNCRFLQDGADTDGGAVARIREAVRARQEIRETLRNRRKDGSLFWNELFIAPIAADGEVGAFVGVQTDVTAQREAERRLAHLAAHDPLTGLLNRRGLQDRIAAAQARQARDGVPAALAVVDLDDFKLVNDRHGHQAGDGFLRQVAEALRGALRGSDVAARVGGDEFALLLEDCDEAAAAPIVERVVAAASGSITGQPVTVSAGIATLRPQDGADAALREADIALYHAKEQGKNRAVRYSGAGTSTLGWAERVRRAIDEDRLRLHWQPIMELRGRTVSHHELLLRPTESDMTLSPGPFLAAAERFGMAPEVDRWVIRQAGDLARRGHAVAVNLSGRSLGDSAVLDEIRAVVGAAGVDPVAVRFEVTETAAIGNLGEAAAFADAIRALGCRLVLDDFGTGFGAFAYLRNLPISGVKIGMEFVQALPSSGVDQRIVEAIVSVAGHLGLTTVAEGVEEQRTLGLLDGMGVTCAQGYAIGRPAPCPP